MINRGIERRLIFYGEAYYQKFEELLGFLALILNIQFLRTSCSQAGPTTSLAMNRYLAMPVAQNTPIGVGLLCPSYSVGDDPMDMGIVIDREGFVPSSKEENATTSTVECAAAAEYLATLKPRHENQFVGNGKSVRRWGEASRGGLRSRLLSL